VYSYRDAVVSKRCYGLKLGNVYRATKYAVVPHIILQIVAAVARVFECMKE